MLTRLERVWSAAFAVLLLSGCSGTDGSDGAWHGDGPTGAFGDAAVLADVGTVLPGQPDSAKDIMDCTPFLPAIPCAAGTACPEGSYCDVKQPMPTCTKYRCLPNGSACSGDGYCMSGLCIAGVCVDVPAEGAACANGYCQLPLRCLGFPHTCMKPKALGGSCESDLWCAHAPGYSTWDGSADTEYCLAGVCGHNPCRKSDLASGCGGSEKCPAGTDCLKGACVQLYCGTDGVPCGKEAHCASGFGCISDRCRKLNVPIHCAGTPTEENCSRMRSDFPFPGCTVAGSSCSGVAEDCLVHQFEIGGTGACVGASGCSWDSTSKRCLGSPTPCNQLAGTSTYCTAPNGCTPTLATSGSPTTCARLTVEECRWQPGCELSTVGEY